MVQKKFPIIAIVIIAVGVMAVAVVNMKSHPQDPSPMVSIPKPQAPQESTQQIKDQISKSVQSSAGGKTSSTPMLASSATPGKANGDHGPYSDNGMVVKNTSNEKPKVSDGSINGGWYSNQAPSSYPKLKAKGKDSGDVPSKN